MRTKTLWITVDGKDIPADRIKDSEKIKEKHAKKIIKMATELSKKLEDLKVYIAVASQEVIEEVALEKNLEAGDKKGNLRWHNFDKSIRIENSVNQKIVFDDGKIALAKDLLDNFLNEKLSSSDVWVKDIIVDAFSTTRGNMDTRKVMSLFKYQSKINDPMFQKSLELIADAIDRPSSKIYSRVYVRNEAGEYENINLNFSSL